MKPVLSFFLCRSPFFSEKFCARIALERRFPTRSTHSIPGFCPSSVAFHFTFPKWIAAGLGWPKARLARMSSTCPRHRFSTNLLDFLEQVGEVAQATDRRAGVRSRGQRRTWAQRPAILTQVPNRLFHRGSDYSHAPEYALSGEFRLASAARYLLSS